MGVGGERGVRPAADGSAERDQWCIDNWDAVDVSLGVASHQLMVARALRERVPRVAEVFAAGQISYRPSLSPSTMRRR